MLGGVREGWESSYQNMSVLSVLCSSIVVLYSHCWTARIHGTVALSTLSAALRIHAHASVVECVGQDSCKRSVLKVLTTVTCC